MTDKTVSSALSDATQSLTGAGIASAWIDAPVLLAHALGITRGELLTEYDKVLNDKELSGFQSLLLRRSKKEPVAYIIGKKEFWSLDFCVTRDTLIPRPDSETLVKAALERVESRAKPINLLDIGTGSGCLLIALLTELPAAQGVGVDNCKGALQTAEENARRHGVSGRSRFLESHWCNAIDGTFDLILSNPPYIATDAIVALMPDVAAFEPNSALDGGRDGLDAYRVLAPEVAARLAAGGHACFEVGEGQAEAVSGLFEKEGLRTQTETDLAGITRCVIASRIS